MASVQLGRFLRAGLRVGQVSSFTPRSTVNFPRLCFSTAPASSNKHMFNIQDNEDFEDRVINNRSPVIVDFHAEWCGPCKLLGPRLERVVAERHGKIQLAKVNIDDLDDLAMDYKVRSVPTVIAVKDGRETDRLVGLQEDDLLEAFVDKAIS